MTKIIWTTEKKKVSDLIPSKFNPRKISPFKKKKLKESLDRFGLVEIPCINLDSSIIAGHQRIEALALKGEIDELIDVRIPSRQLTEKEVKQYMLVSNTHSGEFDEILLEENFSEIDLEELGLSDELIFGKKEELEAEEDDYEIPDEIKTDIVLGDLFEVGHHRLLCGDSTDSDQVSKLMGGMLADLVVTDPPYNTGMKGKPNDAKAWLSQMFNDSFTPEQWEELKTGAFNNYNLFSKGECALYVFIDWRRVAEFKAQLETFADVKNVIVWDKGVHGLGSDYKSTYENIVVGKKGKPQINNRIGLDYQDIWRVQRTMGRDKDHATKKPIEILNKPILHASKQDDIVLDLFGGSGSTMISCHQLKRKAFLQEIDPKYCQVIVERMVKLDNNITVKRNGIDVTDQFKNSGKKLKETK